MSNFWGVLWFWLAILLAASNSTRLLNSEMAPAAAAAQSLASLSKSRPIFLAILLLTVHPQQLSSVSHHPLNDSNQIFFFLMIVE